jgi:hypothetical protein
MDEALADSFADDLEPPPVRVAAMRRCLGCGRLFPSRSAGNRICYRCHKSGNWRDGLTQYTLFF